jgi:hypothetical protein
MASEKDENSDRVERVIDALEEITQTHRVRRPTPAIGSLNPRTWHWITQLLSATVLVGTLVGLLGRAFFVSREEYTKSDGANAVAHESLRQTLDRVDRTLQAQTQALADMSKALQAQAVELAAIKRGK